MPRKNKRGREKTKLERQELERIKQQICYMRRNRAQQEEGKQTERDLDPEDKRQRQKEDEPLKERSLSTENERKTVHEIATEKKEEINGNIVREEERQINRRNLNIATEEESQTKTNVDTEKERQRKRTKGNKATEEERQTNRNVDTEEERPTKRTKGNIATEEERQTKTDIETEKDIQTKRTKGNIVTEEEGQTKRTQGNIATATERQTKRTKANIATEEERQTKINIETEEERQTKRTKGNKATEIERQTKTTIETEEERQTKRTKRNIAREEERQTRRTNGNIAAEEEIQTKRNVNTEKDRQTKTYVETEEKKRTKRTKGNIASEVERQAKRDVDTEKERQAKTNFETGEERQSKKTKENIATEEERKKKKTKGNIATEEERQTKRNVDIEKERQTKRNVDTGKERQTKTNIETDEERQTKRNVDPEEESKTKTNIETEEETHTKRTKRNIDTEKEGQTKRTKRNITTDNRNIDTEKEPQTEIDLDTEEEPQTEKDLYTDEEPQTEIDLDTDEEPQLESEFDTEEEPQTERDLDTEEEPQTKKELSTEEEPQTDRDLGTEEERQSEEAYNHSYPKDGKNEEKDSENEKDSKKPNVTSDSDKADENDLDDSSELDDSSVLDDSSLKVPEAMTVVLDKNKWNEVKVEQIARGFKLSRNWMRIFYDGISKKFAACPLVGTYNHVRREDSRKENTPFFHGKGECSVKGCDVKFKFEIQEVIDEMPVEVQVTSIGSNKVNHPEHIKKARPFQGELRDQAKRKIDEIGPSNFYYERLEDADEEALSHGNYTGVGNKTVIKKIASETVHDAILHQSMTTELELLRDAFISEDSTSREVKGLIQFLSVTPFTVHLYTEEQLMILCELLRKGQPSDLYFDATGSVVCQIPTQRKSVYYYPLLIKGVRRGDPPIPVAEMITNSHTIPDMVNFLMRLFRHCKSLRSTCTLPRKIEIDWSWPFLHAATLVCNKESIPAYLARAAIIVEGRSREEQRLKTVVHVCSAHFLHLISRHLVRICNNKKVRSFILYCTAILIDCGTLQSFQEAFRAILIVLASNSKASHQDYDESLEYITDRIENRNIHVEKNAKTEDEPEDVNTISIEENIKQSYFAVLGQSIYERVRDELRNTDAGEDNGLQSTPAIRLLLRYVAYLPFWSGMLLGNLERHEMGVEVESDPKHDTNTVAENWMKIVKENILVGRKRLRPAEFIIRMNKNRKGRLREFEMARKEESGTKPKRRGRKRLDPNDEQQEEVWGRSKGRKGKYFGKRKQENKKGKTNSKPKRKHKTTYEISTEDDESENDFKDDRANEKYFGKPKQENKTGKTNSKPNVQNKQRKHKTTYEINTEDDESENDFKDDRANENQKSSNARNRQGNPFSSSSSRKSRNQNRVLHWGGNLIINGRPIVLSNTCPVDNLLFMTHTILSNNASHVEWLQTHTRSIPVCQILLDIHALFQRGHWQQGRRRWLEDCCQFSCATLEWNVWGSENERFTMPFGPIQETIAEASCNNPSCPESDSTWRTSEIILTGDELDRPKDINAAVKRWEVMRPSTCNAKRQSAQRCQGEKTWRRRRFVNADPPILIISVDFLSQRYGFTGYNLPRQVHVLGKWYNVFGFTINRRAHFKGFFKTPDGWCSYDDTRTPEIMTVYQREINAQTHIIHIVLSISE